MFINGRFLARPLTGVDRFGREVMVAMDALLTERAASERDWKVVVSRTASDLPKLTTMTYVVAGKGSGMSWEQTVLPIAVGRGFLLNFCNTAPLVKRRQMIVMHDAAPARIPQAYSAAFRRWYGLIMPRLGRQAEHVFTVSKFSRTEIAAAYGIPLEKITALPLQGVEHIRRGGVDGSVLDRHGLRARPYALAVSSRAPHKNFGLLAEAVRQLENPNFDLVVAGGTNPRVFSSAGAGLPDWVKYVGYVTDAELKALYENASCFVFPSLYEGYGLPPLEAMACGAPALVARAASMPEVYGDAAAYFDPHSAADLAALLRSVLASPDTLRSLRDRGQALARRSTWRSIAEVMLSSASGKGARR